ncbi:MAG: ATPase, partial [Saprospiraceae bacterium]|nr:ATPase [Saprospiraceae bacterium]
MVEAATGVNLWTEWAALESAMVRGEAYQLPDLSNYFAGSIMSLSKFEDPDDSSFQDPEIWWRLKKKNHIGFILQSSDANRISELLDHYAQRIMEEFHAAMPAADRPSN